MRYMTSTRASTGRDQLLGATIEHLATNSVDNQSLRGIATAIGSSHRMLIYHFGSRDGLLSSVVSEVERMQRASFQVLFEGDDPDSPRALAERFWSEVVGTATKYGPLFFELSAHAMQHRPHAVNMKSSLVEPWLQVLADELISGGMDPTRARAQARLGLAVVRGLIFDLLVSGDRSGVDDAYRLFLDIFDSSAPDSATSK